MSDQGLTREDWIAYILSTFHALPDGYDKAVEITMAKEPTPESPEDSALLMTWVDYIFQDRERIVE